MKPSAPTRKPKITVELTADDLERLFRALTVGNHRDPANQSPWKESFHDSEKQALIHAWQLLSPLMEAMGDTSTLFSPWRFLMQGDMSRGPYMEPRNPNHRRNSEEP